MKFYHCFYTTLPDQFVEANADRLIKWVDDWKGKNRYHLRSRVVDMIPINVSNSIKDDYPTLYTAAPGWIKHWLVQKGHLYNGRYWESLTEDQRSPVRIASLSSGAIDPDDASFGTSTAAMYLAQSRRASRVVIGLPPASWRLLNGPGGITWIDEYKPIPKPPLRRDAIVAGEIIGYRCWKIENGLLRSVYQSDIWPPNAILEGRELDDWNERGIHAWKSSSSKEYHNYIRGYLNSEHDTYTQMQNAIIYGRSIALRETKPAMITGTVFLWGDVVEHERGYRAEYARVRSLDWLYPDEPMMGKEQETLDDLRQKYGVGEMTILYNAHTDGDHYRITKFSDGEVESSYLCSTTECQCPAGQRPSCRHRLMLPMFIARGAVNSFWFLDWQRKGWVSNEIKSYEEPEGLDEGEDIEGIDSKRSELGSPKPYDAFDYTDRGELGSSWPNPLTDRIVDTIDSTPIISTEPSTKPSWRRL